MKEFVKAKLERIVEVRRGVQGVNRRWMMGREERFVFWSLMAIILLFNYPIGIWHMSALSKNFPIENTEATRKANADSFILWSLNLSHQQATIIALTNGWFLFLSLVLLTWVAQTWLLTQLEQLSRCHFLSLHRGNICWKLTLHPPEGRTTFVVLGHPGPSRLSPLSQSCQEQSSADVWAANLSRSAKTRVNWH